MIDDLPSLSAANARCAELDALWARFIQSCEVDDRNKLVEAYKHFARMLAAKAYARRTSADTEFADYLQYAHIGLLESVERFDPGRGAKFETYASARISGAILNGLASESELREQLAARRRAIAQRAELLREEAEPAPGDVFGKLADIAIGLAVGFMLEGSGMFQAQDELAPDNTYSSVELRQLQRQLRDAIDKLPERQRHVIFSHYLQYQSFDEITASLGISRGRVSQLHKQALATLRAALRSRHELDVSC